METNVRVVGSGYTILEYAGQPLAYLMQFSDSGQQQLGAGIESVIPLGARHPVEIVTGRVLDSGTLRARIKELWDAPVWYQLQGLAGRRTITDVWEALAQMPGVVTCRMLIKPPNNRPIRGKIYHGCVISAIDDSEQVTVGGLSVDRDITIAYTHTTGV